MNGLVVRFSLHRHRRTLADDFLDIYDVIYTVAVDKFYEYSMHCPFPSNDFVQSYWGSLRHSDKTEIFRSWSIANVAAIQELRGHAFFYSRGKPTNEAYARELIVVAQDLLGMLECRFEVLAQSYHHATNGSYLNPRPQDAPQDNPAGA